MVDARLHKADVEDVTHPATQFMWEILIREPKFFLAPGGLFVVSMSFAPKTGAVESSF